MYVEKRHFDEMCRLHLEAEEVVGDAETILLELWRETKDKRIEDFFRRQGGMMVDGEFRFHENDV